MSDSYLHLDVIQTEGSSTKSWNLDITAKYISKNKENKEMKSNTIDEKLEILVMKAVNNLISNLKSDLNGLLVPTIEFEVQPQVEVEVEAVGEKEKSDSEELSKKLKKRKEDSVELSVDNEVTSVVRSTASSSSSSPVSPPLSPSSSSSTTSTTISSTASSVSSSSSSTTSTTTSSNTSNMNLGGISDLNDIDIKAAYKALERAADIVNPNKKFSTSDEGSAKEKRNGKGFRNDGKFIDISETSQVTKIYKSMNLMIIVLLVSII